MAEIKLEEALEKEIIVPKSFDDNYSITNLVSHDKLTIDIDIIDQFDKLLSENNFYLPEESTKIMLIVGLLQGNVILQGPPGTGKTTLAGILAELFSNTSEIITATSDWTTYDTIGGLYPSVDDNGIEVLGGKNGKIVDSILKCCNEILMNKNNESKYQSHWLIIDELNRSEIDKVFGDLFTVFGSNDTSPKSLDLWFHSDFKKRKIYVPSRFRIIGTMNNIDKNFVNDLSQGLSRRFSFITINPPCEDKFFEEIEYIKNKAWLNIDSKLGIDKFDLFKERVLDNYTFNSLEKELLEIIKMMRYDGENRLNLQIGTAQLIDLFELIYLQLLIDMRLDEKNIKHTFDNAITDKIVPLLDGFYYEKIHDFKNFLINNHSDFKQVINSLSEYD